MKRILITLGLILNLVHASANEILIEARNIISTNTEVGPEKNEMRYSICATFNDQVIRGSCARELNILGFQKKVFHSLRTAERWVIMNNDRLLNHCSKRQINLNKCKYTTFSHEYKSKLVSFSVLLKTGETIMLKQRYDSPYNAGELPLQKEQYLVENILKNKNTLFWNQSPICYREALVFYKNTEIFVTKRIPLDFKDCTHPAQGISVIEKQ